MPARDKWLKGIRVSTMLPDLRTVIKSYKLQLLQVSHSFTCSHLNSLSQDLQPNITVTRKHTNYTISQFIKLQVLSSRFLVTKIIPYSWRCGIGDYRYSTWFTSVPAMDNNHHSLSHKIKFPTI